MDSRSHLGELLAVLVRVMCAEQQLAAAAQLHAEVGLSAATVAPVHGGEAAGGLFSGGVGHARPSFPNYLCAVPNVARPSNIPLLGAQQPSNLLLTWLLASR